MKAWPAIDIRPAPDADLLLAAVDDFSPTAAEEHGDTFRIFFASAADRDAACDHLASRGFTVTLLDVSDEDWAARSQQALTPVTVGALVITPPWAIPADSASASTIPVMIQPSMGFGTGHHPTTRLCLMALQNIDLKGASVLDVGTGSGVLALAAVRLGALRAVGIDNDPDAIQSANENLALNGNAGDVRFEVRDLAAEALPRVDVLTANLTGALLVRSAATLQAAVREAGILILSGLLASERAEVRAAFGRAELIWEGEEEGWTALALAKR